MAGSTSDQSGGESTSSPRARQRKPPPKPVETAAAEPTAETAVEPVEASPPREALEQALVEIKRVIAGQDEMLERVLVCLVAGGHLLIEGVPGLAKTLTIKTTAAVLGGSFRRVQFTPDPSPRPRRHARLPPRLGHLRRGARPSGLQLPPRRRDQPGAREGAVGAPRGDAGAPGDDRPRHVPQPDPFLVMATQNPIESEGTYPLPEAQVDRFLLKVRVDYPQRDEELTVVQLVARRPAACPPGARSRGT